jgi:hypothetical protein
VVYLGGGRGQLLLAASARHDAIQLASAARVPKPLTGLEKGARAKWHKELNLDPPQPKPHPWLDPDLPLSDAERRQVLVSHDTHTQHT